MLDMKPNSSNFFIFIQNGHKAAEITCNINTFGRGTANECTVQWWFQKFCKGDEWLEDKQHSGQPSEVDDDQLRAIMEADPLTATWEVAKELNIDHSWSFSM